MNARSGSALILDSSEMHHRIPSHHIGLNLFLRHMAPTQPPAYSKPKVLLYVHGGTFPSALSIAHRFDDRSWRDELAHAGYDVWAVDFHGFGASSDPFPEMSDPADAHAPLGRAADASRQIATAVHFICGRQGVERVSIIAHSWGTIAAGHFAGHCPELVDRLVFFGPITFRSGQDSQPRLPAWRLISLQDQWDRFVADTPKDEPPVLLDRHFKEWGECYLDCDPDSRTRMPHAVKIPLGPIQDIYDAWAGELAYDPGLIKAPVGIIRGAWDSMCTDADARWLWDALASSPHKRDVKLSRAGHLAHLEESRYALYSESLAFLGGRDSVPDQLPPGLHRTITTDSSRA